jgi:virulence factor Mce-like protein
VLVLSGCSVYDVPLPGGADTGDKPMRVTVMFRDVLDLVPQSNVKVNDVTVGKITEIELKGYVAQVTLELPNDVKLPDNTTAQIRQTSLLGEKFVSLAPPQEPSSDRLGNGDTIGLDRTGRNPEVEEVLGALALLLNGGGVGQLKTIASEMNKAFEGRETEVRSVLTQIRVFMGQLDGNKESIVAALENTNRLAVQLRRQQGTVNSALDRIPDALRSVNRQRADLVKMLRALERLSGVGVRVIQASKQSTINSLRDLGPVLEEFAAAGQAMPDSLQVFLTYPFVDAAVGNDPQVARNLHMGDYTNLSVDLDVNLADLPKLPAPPTEVCEALAQIRAAVNDLADQGADRVVEPLEDRAGVPGTLVRQIREEVRRQVIDEFLDEAERQCQQPDPSAVTDFVDGLLEDPPNDLQELLDRLPDTALDDLLGTLPGPGVGGGGGGPGGGNPGGGNLPEVPGLPRSDLNGSFRLPESIDPFDLSQYGLDPGTGTLLLQGVATTR